MRRRTDPERYGELVRRLVSSLTSPGGLLGALEVRMSSLAEQERFEEAALVRDRLRALAEGLSRARQDAWIAGAGALVLEADDGAVLRLSGGALVRGDGAEPIPLPCPRDRADELRAVRSWLVRNRVRVTAADRPPAEPVEGGRQLASILRRLRSPERDEPGGRGRSRAGRR